MAFGDFHGVQPGDGIGQIINIRAAFPGTNSFFPVDHKRVSRDRLGRQRQPDGAADIDRVVVHLPCFDFADGVVARRVVDVQRNTGTRPAAVEAEGETWAFRRPAIIFRTDAE